MATTSVGNVIFQISADIKGVQGQLRTLETNFNTSFGKISSIAKSALGSFGIGLGVGTLVAAAKGFADLATSATKYADEIGKAAQRTGVTTEFLSAMKHGANLADISFEDLQTGLGRFNKSMVEAAQGSKESSAAFATLGIKVTDVNGKLRSNEEVLGDVAEAFKKMPDGPQKTALAMELMSRGGAKMITLLNGGRDSIAQFTAEAERMGLIVTGPMAKAAEEFNDNMTRLGAQVEGLKLSIGNGLIPVITRLLDLFAELGGVKLEGLEERQIQRQITTFKELQRLATAGTRGWEAYAKTIADLEEKLKTVQAAKPAAVPPGPPPPLGLTDAQKKLAEELKKVAETIGIENEKLVAQRIELTQGKAAAEEFLLKQQELRETAKGATGAIIHEQDRRRALTVDVKALSDAYDRLKRAVDATRGGPPEEISLALSPEELTEATVAWDKMQAERKAAAETALTGIAELEKNLTMELTDEALKRGVAITQEFDERIAQINKWKEATTAAFEAGALSLDEYVAAWNRLDQVAVGVGESAATQLRDDTQAALDAAFEPFSGIGDAISRGIADTMRGIREGSQTISEGLNNMLRNILLSLNEEMVDAAIVQPIKRMVDSFFKGFAEAFAEAGDDTAEKIAKDLGNSLGTWLKDMLAGLNVGGGGEGGGLLGGILSSIGSFFGGFFAEGGSVGADKPIVVGEKGPELFVPKTSGKIVPNYAFSAFSSGSSTAMAGAAMGNDYGGRGGAGGEGGRKIDVSFDMDFKNAQIIPRAPWTEPKDVVGISVKSIKDKGALYGGMVQYGPQRR